MEKAKKEKVKKPLYKRIIDGIGIALIAIFGTLVAIFAIGSFTGKTVNGVKMIYNHSTLVVLTDSMEPTYKVDSAIIIEKVKASDVKVGDDLTFYYDSWGVVVTHRVLEITSPSEGSEIYTFKLHGINTESTQCGNGVPADCTDQYQIITSDRVIGRVIYNSLALGKTYKFMMTPYGLIILLLIPGGYLIYVSLESIIKALKQQDEKEVKETSNAVNNASSGGKLASLSKEEKEKLKQQLLDEMLKGKEKKDE